MKKLIDWKWKIWLTRGEALVSANEHCQSRHDAWSPTLPICPIRRMNVHISTDGTRHSGICCLPSHTSPPRQDSKTENCHTHLQFREAKNIRISLLSLFSPIWVTGGIIFKKHGDIHTSNAMQNANQHHLSALKNISCFSERAKIKTNTSRTTQSSWMAYLFHTTGWLC